ncbi:MAG: AAA domain-containing protein [Gammaproteobacteria bacterium]|nr:AAA domain-containing protein [Gammaproteobacteria bacterium]NIO23708.1 AAA domain-containing protein [Gammaproteobacteria bacterium]NIO64324.1 AAA domain-containing protein [Gammaproteobacteria bacterium]NIP46154.1 AAA domain-containing protein [Gammaproteobacteria bacterium]NIP63206.1 AAA domain-containing protein [Gammaproteobacteria bacterium]
MARGHLLIEDIPGVGKTTLAHVLARILGLSFQRVQFTSDLLPADILGISVYDRRAGSFEFHPGPIFTNLVLADEVNRATPKTQSALLEAMEERQVSQDRVTRDLPDPFFVIATQNPDHNVGTFPLPESQLDRFLMRITLGYPDAKSERALLTGCDRRELVEALEPALEVAELLDIQKQVQKVHVSDALLDYLQDLIAATRSEPDLGPGLSPRAGLALLRCSQAWAFMEDRRHVLPEDVQAVLPSVVNHRLRQATASTDALLRQVPIP